VPCDPADASRFAASTPSSLGASPARSSSRGSGRAILPMMAKEKAPERSTVPSEATVMTVTITVPPQVRRRPLRERVRGIGVLHRPRTALAVALGLAAQGALIATAMQSSRTRAHAQDSERAAIAAAFGYPYPPRCLTVTISASNPDYARVTVARRKGCGRYHGYVNASFHQVVGMWRLVLDEGQLFVANGLLTACRAGRAGCARSGGTSGGKGSQSRTVGSGKVAAEFRYRLGCLSLAIALHDPRFARAEFDRTVCTRAQAR
jgi:hypothetical protein